MYEKAELTGMAALEKYRYLYSRVIIYKAYVLSYNLGMFLIKVKQRGY